jgi:NDP-sugar pyrophosphorylase family protein
MTSRRAVILAGGLGLRIRHRLAGVPKPMAPVAGRPFVEWVVRWIHQAGEVDEFVLSTGYLAEVVKAHFDSFTHPRIRVRCCAEPRPLGTAGAFLHCVTSDARPAPAAWLVANGDSLVLADLRPLWRALDDASCNGALLAVRVPDASRFGTVETAADGTLAGFREKRPGRGLVNAGIYVYRHQLLRDFPPTLPLSFETEVFPALVPHQRIAVVETCAPFLDIGTEETLGEAEAFLRMHRHRFGLPRESNHNEG